MGVRKEDQPDIILCGYYGHGNFGDDILLTVAYSILREINPKASIGILTCGDKEKIAKLLASSSLTFIGYGERSWHQLIVHGGGGTFFDFGDYPLARRLLNKTILALGSGVYASIDALIRKFARKPRLSADRRIGLGIGVGTFSPGSRKLLKALPVLSSFDFLWLRDATSQTNLARLGISLKTAIAPDLAFLYERWMPQDALAPKVSNSPLKRRIAIILRDWPLSKNKTSFVSGFGTVIASLANAYDVTLISLDPGTDEEFLASSSSLPQFIWRSGQTTISEFCQQLISQDAIITSRAHGAICAAILGVPSLILAIEPKLHAIHKMLPVSTRECAPTSSYMQINQLLQDVFSIDKNAIRNEVDQNRRLCKSALGEARPFLRIQIES